MGDERIHHQPATFQVQHNVEAIHEPGGKIGGRLRHYTILLMYATLIRSRRKTPLIASRVKIQFGNDEADLPSHGSI